MNEQPTGFLLIDKPAGITSHDVVDKLRRITKIKKIGHAGTLDPFATGLLILAVSRSATKKISEFVGMDKDYEAEFVIGATTETLDSEAKIILDEHKPNEISYIDILSAIESLTGEIAQIPPMYSAIKKDGKKLYELARKGETIKREPRHVTIYEFNQLSKSIIESGLVKLKVHIKCSSGTYIRALARDLATKLGTTGYVSELRRTSIGNFLIKDAKKLEDLSPENWQDHLLNL